MTGARNIFDLPVVASGDGGAYTTVADVHRLWGALTAGGVLPPRLWEAMREPVTPDADDGRGYGRGLWLDGPFVSLSGMDYGASALSLHDPSTGVTATSLANAEVPILGQDALGHGRRPRGCRRPRVASGDAPVPDRCRR